MVIGTYMRNTVSIVILMPRHLVVFQITPAESNESTDSADDSEVNENSSSNHITRHCTPTIVNKRHHALKIPFRWSRRTVSDPAASLNTVSCICRMQMRNLKQMRTKRRSWVTLIMLKYLCFLSCRTIVRSWQTMD